MTTPPPEDAIAAELEKALTHFGRVVDALKQADAVAEGYAETAEKSAKRQKRVLTEKESAAVRLHDEVHAIKEEAYDVFTQVASLEIRTRMPLDEASDDDEV